jgi:hypothetical protein
MDLISHRNQKAKKPNVGNKFSLPMIKNHEQSADLAFGLCSLRTLPEFISLIPQSILLRPGLDRLFDEHEAEMERWMGKMTDRSTNAEIHCEIPGGITALHPDVIHPGKTQNFRKFSPLS